MTQEHAFLAAIRDDPDDDLHRLAWADWLDDHGDTRRADFIRAQVRLAALPEGHLDRDALEDEADDLLEGHDQQWAGPVAQIAQEWTWRRGCIERVTAWGDTLLTRGDELFQIAPVREVRLLAEADDMPRLAGCEFLNRVVALDLSRNTQDSNAVVPFHRDRPLQQLFVSPHLTRLKRLLMRYQGIERPAIQTLIDTGLFGRLEELDLGENRALGDGGTRLLAAERSNTLVTLVVRGTNVTALGMGQLLQARSWPALRRLEFVANVLFRDELTGRAFEEVWCRHPLTTQLTSFHWAGRPLGSEGLGCLLNWEGAARLERLVLYGCGLGAADAEILAGCERLRALRTLALMNNQLRDAGARALAGSPHLAGLTELNLTSNGIGGPGIRALTSSTFADVRTLKLAANFVGDAGAEALAAGTGRLRQLRLSNCNLGADAAKRLAGSPSLGRLRELELAGNALHDDGVKALAASAHLRRLRQLHLDSCSFSDEGAKALADSPYLNRLTRLSLRNTYVTGLERDRLEARFGEAAQF